MPRRMNRSESVVDDVDRLEPAGDPNGQALVGELVDDVEQAELAAIMGALLDKVVGPDMVGTLRSQPDARSVIEPQPSTLGLSGRGTFPSRRQIRSTRLSLTRQP